MTSFIGLQTLVPHLGGNLLPYTLNFATQAFDGAWTAPNWAVSAGTAKNTPTEGIELITNVEFTTNTANWTPQVCVLSRVDSEVDPGVNSGGVDKWALNVAKNSTGFGARAIQTIATAAAGEWLISSALGYSPSANSSSNAASLSYLNVVSSGKATTTEDVWQLLSASGRVSGLAILLLNCNGNIATDVSYFDKISSKKITSLLAYRNFPGAANAIVSATGNISAGYQSGVVARVSADGTQYLHAYHDRTTCYLLKVLTTGTTPLIGIVTAYVAGVLPQIRCSGNTIQLFYNGSQVGTDQTETTLSANTRHGLFSTNVSNTFNTFSVVKN